jgi:hypothetical protein
MMNQGNAEVDGVLVGDYVDDAGSPANPLSPQSEVVRPQIVANCLDVWGLDDGLREFTVLLKNGQVIVVRGHCLKSELPHASVFSILVRSGEQEVVVALFKSEEVSGIFHGEMRPDRKIA